MRFGRHLPTESKPLQAVSIARELGCEVIQIFVNNPTAWSSPQMEWIQGMLRAMAQRAASRSG